MTAGWADRLIFIIASEAQVFKNIAADFAFEFIDRHVQRLSRFSLRNNTPATCIS
jgi:hypothetical protein